MKLDNDKQRETLINAIQSAQLSGMVSELLPLLEEIATLVNCIKFAELDQKTTEAPKEQ